MSATVTIAQSVSGLGDSLSGSKTISDSKGQILDEPIPASSVDLSIPTFKLDVSQLKAFAMVADVDMTVKTNTAPVGVDTFVLSAGTPRIYDGTGTNPFSADVTGLFVSSTSAGTLKIRSVEDATP